MPECCLLRALPFFSALTFVVKAGGMRVTQNKPAKSESPEPTTTEPEEVEEQAAVAKGKAPTLVVAGFETHVCTSIPLVFIISSYC